MARVEIPDKLYFKIGEVSDIVGVEAYVLRFWEGEFPNLTPKKTDAGHRLYRKKDLETLLRIKELLYEKGYTIAGARKLLGRARGIQAGDPTVQTLRSVRQGLEDILTMLDDAEEPDP